MEDGQQKSKTRKPRRSLRYELTEALLQKISKRKPPEKDTDYRDGKGLFLRHTTTGEMIWKLIYTVKGLKNKKGTNQLRTIMTLGRYINKSRFDKDDLKDIQCMSLDEARIEARKIWLLCRQGIDPKIHKQYINEEISKNNATFKEVFDLWYEDKIKNSSITEQSKQKIKVRVEKYLVPLFEDLLFKNITSKIVKKKLIDRFINKKDEKDKKPLTIVFTDSISYLNRIGKWAFKNGYNEKNIAEDLAEECKEIKPETHHIAAIKDPKKLGEYLNRLDLFKDRGLEVVSDAMTVITYIPVRAQELYGAMVCEFDFENNLWIIPKERTKTRKEFIVPLPNKIADMIKCRIEKNAGNKESGYVFQSHKEHIGESTLRNRLRTMGYSKSEASIHGFRSSFSTIMRMADIYSDEIIERNLSHSYGSPVSQAYNRGDYLELRRQCYEDYGYILDGLKEGKNFKDIVKELKRKHFEEDMKNPYEINTTKS